MAPPAPESDRWGGEVCSSQHHPGTFYHQPERDTVPELNIHRCIVQAAEFLEQPRELFFRCAFSWVSLVLRVRVQLYGLNNSGFWFEARKTTPNGKALNNTEAQCSAGLYNPGLTRH